MKIQLMNNAEAKWEDLTETDWFRIVTDFGTFNISGQDRMLEDGFVYIRAVDDGRVEITPVASNAFGLRSSKGRQALRTPQ